MAGVSRNNGYPCQEQSSYYSLLRKRYMMQNNISRIDNAISIDVEDWYYPDFSVSESHISKVSDKILIILDILGQHNIKATFFIVGMVAEKLPQIIKRISAAGHEIGTHGYMHKLVYNLKPEEFKDDLKKSVSILEDLSGEKVLGYRAPYASITKKSLWAFDIMYELGLKYDSSILPSKNFICGIPDCSWKLHWARNRKGEIVEFPFSIFNLFGKNIPIGGGFYLRLLPYTLTKYCINQINRTHNPVMVYIHPRELDLEPPRFNVTLRWNLIYYYNLKSTQEKLRSLLKDFNFLPVKDIVQGWIVMNS